MILNNKSYTWELSIKVFLPWASFAIFTATYMTNFAENFDPTTQNLDSCSIGLQWIIWPLLLFNVFLELVQIKNFRLLYFVDPWNYIYNIIYTITSLVLLNDTKMKTIPYITE